MKQLLFTIFAFFQVNLLFASSPTPPKDSLSALDHFANGLEGLVFYSLKINETISIPLVLILLVFAAVFFTVYFNFLSITGFKHALDIVRGKFDDPKDTGDVSHFQALTTALSGTVGIGNIAGVAIAVSVGGPGATFWMIIAGILGMSTKFIECTLGVKYRSINADGSVSGGPMYYLSKGLAKRGFAGLGKVLAVLFAVACIGGSFGGGNMFQINQATQQIIEVTGGAESVFFDKPWIFGLLMAAFIGVVIIGGIKSIAKVTDKIVPFMVGVYLLAALSILVVNFSEIPSAFLAIFNGAFNPTAVAGGFVGVLIQGFRRAAFSNEAGIGSASIAHAAAKTQEPVSEGIVALLEPFIDTVMVCTMTALVIVITGAYEVEGLGGVALTSNAFTSVFSWFPLVLSSAVILFALSTAISWSYYGLKTWTYLFGENKAAEIIYKALFCVAVVVGSVISLDSVIKISDSMIFIMCIPNILGLLILAPEVKKDLNEYFHKVKTGIIKRYDANGVEEKQKSELQEA